MCRYDIEFKLNTPQVYVESTPVHVFSHLSENGCRASGPKSIYQLITTADFDRLLESEKLHYVDYIIIKRHYHRKSPSGATGDNI